MLWSFNIKKTMNDINLRKLLKSKINWNHWSNQMIFGAEKGPRWQLLVCHVIYRLHVRFLEVSWASNNRACYLFPSTKVTQYRLGSPSPPVWGGTEALVSQCSHGYDACEDVWKRGKFLTWVKTGKMDKWQNCAILELKIRTIHTKKPLVLL